MKVTMQVVLHADDDTETVVREAFTVQRGALAPDTLGLQLEEAKDLLATVQDTLVEHQVAAALASAGERDKPWEATRLDPAGRGCG